MTRIPAMLLAVAALCAACAEAPPPPPPAPMPTYESCQERAQSITDQLVAGTTSEGSTSTIESDGDNWRIQYAGHNGHGATFFVDKHSCRVVRSLLTQ